MMRRKYGKYETRPEGVAAVQPKVKSALLQTYFLSLVSLVVCMTMFFGTSYAWFTSEVTNNANEIHIGTLDVGLYKTTAGQRLDLASADNKLFNGSIRWEPGYTALETIEVVNQGDLAFKYVLSFTEGQVTAGENVTAQGLAEVAAHFDVWVFRHYGKTYVKPSSYAELQQTEGWVKVGTLADLLAGQPLLQGNMNTVRTGDLAEGATAATVPGVEDAVATVDTFTIALHMNENANESAIGHKIKLNVKLVAYQKTQESDAFGSYDRLVATAADLREALENGGSVTLLTDVNLTEGITVSENVTANLNLNGHEIIGVFEEPAALITNEGKLTINGEGAISVFFEGAVNNSKAVNAIENRGELTVNGGEITNTGAGNQIGYAIDNYGGSILTINGGEITASGSSYYDGIRLFCGTLENRVTVNGGQISSIWAQNPSSNKANEVNGTVVINGGNITNVYFENYTTVQMKKGVTVTVTPYGEGSTNTTTEETAEYFIYSFIH